MKAYKIYQISADIMLNLVSYLNLLIINIPGFFFFKTVAYCLIKRTRCVIKKYSTRYRVYCRITSEVENRKAEALGVGNIQGRHHI